MGLQVPVFSVFIMAGVRGPSSLFRGLKLNQQALFLEQGFNSSVRGPSSLFRGLKHSLFSLVSLSIRCPRTLLVIQRTETER